MSVMDALGKTPKTAVEMTIEVRMYNVGFGDCILVTFRDTESSSPPRRILFDCGRHAGSKPPGRGDIKFDQALAALVHDIDDDGRGPNIDVIVVTHRHRDHISGFAQWDVWSQVAVREVWLPWVEDPRNRLARQVTANQNALTTHTIHALRSLAAAAGTDEAKQQADEAIEIAYNATTNAKAMDMLTGLDGKGRFRTPLERIRYLPREGYEPDVLTGDHDESVLPRGVKVHVLGPSRDPRTIKRLDPPDGKSYRALMPASTALGADTPGGDGIQTGIVPEPFSARWEVKRTEYDKFTAKEFDTVKAMVESSTVEPLELVYRLDGAINGTSLVLLIEVGETKLLFPGDAQWGTWDAMLSNPETVGLLKGTALYKVGHHGSHNATPKSFVEDCLSPDATTAALIPVAPTNYGGGWQHIPVGELVSGLRARTKAVVITQVASPATAEHPAVVPQTVYVTTLTGTVQR